ncbi:MAG: preprotein translocase subunit YajC [Actinobacteria bacterium]|nr:preprotein translocase subunit YajC [Actinomycetota bacterium]MCL6088488.1 preprotein translocase subunit YajC [Actinomycetota bacterium]
MKNISKNKLGKLITITVTAVLIVFIGIISFGCLPLTGTAGSTTVATNADGTPVQPSFLAKYGTWLWLIVLVVAFYFLLIRPQRMRSKTQQDLLGNLQRGDEIVTVGGMYGKIKDVGADSIIITISSGVDVKISKSAIARKISHDITTSDRK